MRMNEISIFVDESGDPGETSRYYLITLVFHEQHASIDRIVQPYLQSLIDKGLADIPAHIGPLVNGHDDYENLTMETRKIYLSSFRILAEHLPFRYATLAYEKAWFDDDPVKLLTRMKRDLTSFLFDRIEYLQRFDAVKIYYDNGQAIVTEALHDAVEYVLGKNAIVYKDASPANTACPRSPTTSAPSSSPRSNSPATTPGRPISNSSASGARSRRTT